MVEQKNKMLPSHNHNDHHCEHSSEPIGEDTERELSLSREDDSDLSVMSDCDEEEYKCNTIERAAKAQ